MNNENYDLEVMFVYLLEVFNEVIEFVGNINKFDDICVFMDEFEECIDNFGLSVFVCFGFLWKGWVLVMNELFVYDVLVNKLFNGFIESICCEFKEIDIMFE